MNKAKSSKKSERKSKKKAAKRKATPSKHPVHSVADALRDAVHSKLASAGITGLSLCSIQFTPNNECPDGQHWGKVCETQPDGTEACTWKCVPN